MICRKYDYAIALARALKTQNELTNFSPRVSTLFPPLQASDRVITRQCIERLLYGITTHRRTVPLADAIEISGRGSEVQKK
jgi:hypothetical protein